MAGFCPAPAPDLGMVRSLLGSVDCNVQAMSQLGYGAVAGPGSQLPAILTTLLTLYVAVFGLRLLLGMAPLRVGDLTVMVLKLGVVLALATSWPLYQQLVFNTLFRGPEQLAAQMMAAIQPPGSLLGRNPYDGLQVAYDQFQAASAFFVRISPAASSPFTGGVPFAAMSMTMASYLMLFFSLGMVLVSKIVLGLLLALGPAFVAFLLFDATRGLFEGWLRAALAFALVPLLATVMLVAQLALIEPQLVDLSEMVRSGEPNLGAATSAFILAMVFAGVSLGGLIAIGVIAFSFRLPWRAARPGAQPAPAPAPAVAGGGPQPLAPHAPGAAVALQPIQPRVASVAAAAAALERRDQRRLELVEPALQRQALGMRGGAEFAMAGGAAQPLGQTYKRTAQPRRAASSTRRDG